MGVAWGLALTPMDWSVPSPVASRTPVTTAGYRATLNASERRKAESFGATFNDWNLIHGITSGPGITVVPSKDIVKEAELPPKYHKVLRESAGHCRTRGESAVVMKLLEAVRHSKEYEAARSPPPNHGSRPKSAPLRPPQKMSGSFGVPFHRTPHGSPVKKPGRSAGRQQRSRAAAAKGARTGGAGRPPHSAEAAGRLYANSPAGLGLSEKAFGRPIPSFPAPAPARHPRSAGAASGAASGGAGRRPGGEERRTPTPLSPGPGGLVPYDDDDDFMGSVVIEAADHTASPVAAAGSPRLATGLVQGSGRFVVVAGGGSSPAPSLSRSPGAAAEAATRVGGPGAPSGPPPPLRYGRFVSLLRAGVPRAAVEALLAAEPGLDLAGFDAAVNWHGRGQAKSAPASEGGGGNGGDNSGGSSSGGSGASPGSPPTAATAAATQSAATAGPAAAASAAGPLLRPVFTPNFLGRKGCC